VTTEPAAVFSQQRIDVQIIIGGFGCNRIYRRDQNYTIRTLSCIMEGEEEKGKSRSSGTT